MLLFPRPVLLVDNDPSVVSLVRRVLATPAHRRPLLLLPQYPQVRQYLRDSIARDRTPSTIVLRLAADVIVDPAWGLLQWLREQDGLLATIPVVMLTEWSAVVPDTPLTLIAHHARHDQVARCLLQALEWDAA